MNFKYILVNLFVQNNANQPVRLAKKPTKDDYKIRLNLWIKENFYLIVLAVFLLVLIVFVISCFVIVGSSVESGNYYYHLRSVI